MPAFKSALMQRYGGRVQVLPCEHFTESDILLCDTFRFHYRRHLGVRVLFTGENHAADLNEFDYCISHELHEDDRRLYFPYFMHHALYDSGASYRALQQRTPISRDWFLATKKKFCAFICRNGTCRRRNHFVRRLSAYKRVDCGGSFMDNIGFCVPDKIEFLRGYCFTVAYENAASPGYCTEKLLDAFRARTIPIYWGDDHVTSIFNPHAFVHAHDFRNESALIRHILELSQSPDRMLAILNEPIFLDPQYVDFRLHKFWEFLDAILARGPGAIRRSRWQRFCSFAANFYGHGLFRNLRRFIPDFFRKYLYDVNEYLTSIIRQFDAILFLSLT